MYVFPITNIQSLRSITPIAKVYGIDEPSKLITCVWACTQGLLIKGLLLWTVFLFRSTIYRSCYHELADHYKFPFLNWSQIYYLWDFVYCQNFCYFISFLICVLSTRVMFFFAMFPRGSRANGTCSWINSSIDVISLWWGMPVLDSTLYNKVCQGLPTCPGSPDFSIEITKVLFKLSKNNHSGNTTVPSILYFIQIYR